jgi:hypothetical protein
MFFNVASSLVLSWLVVYTTTPVYAFDYSLDDTSETTMSITDDTTGIPNVKTLFIGELHSIVVDGMSWLPNESNASTTSDLLLWRTTIDGNVVASGNVSLADAGRELPSMIDAGSFTVSTNGKHSIEVRLMVDDSMLIVSGDYVAYRAGVSIIPMLLVLIMAMTTQLVRF